MMGCDGCLSFRSHESFTVVEMLAIPDFYRVNYDTRNWLLLSSMDTLTTASQRVSLVDDALALCRTGRMDYALGLEFLNYLRNETDLAPWEAARRGLSFMGSMMFGTRLEDVYKVSRNGALTHMKFMKRGWEGTIDCLSALDGACSSNESYIGALQYCTHKLQMNV